jgi:chromosome segregation ATPase
MPDVTDALLKPDDPARHGLGGNNPPSPIEILRGDLNEKHAALIARHRELLTMEAALPETMDDEWEAKLTEHVKSCGKFTKASEAQRLHTNESFRELIAASDGFFKGMSAKVDALKDRINEKHLTPYKLRKKDEEQARRDAAAAEAKRIADEQARLAREEAARLAEAKRREEEARRDAERIERERIAAEQRRAEEARIEAERQDAARREAERQATEAKSREERAAAAAARLKADREAAEAKARADREEAEARAKAEREAAEARAAIERAAAERAEQERRAKAERDAADKAKAERAKADKAASAKAADMSRSRTDLGVVSSLRTTWKHRVIPGQEDRVPRQYLEVSDPAVVAAIAAATTKDGKCDLKIPGIEIYPVHTTVTR